MRAEEVNGSCVSDDAEAEGSDDHPGNKLSHDHWKAKLVEEETEEESRCDRDSQIEEKSRGHKLSLVVTRSLQLKHFPTKARRLKARANWVDCDSNTNIFWDPPSKGPGCIPGSTKI